MEMSEQIGRVEDGMREGERLECTGFTAGCPPENKQTSDYDIDANLNVSQQGVSLLQSGA